MEITKRELFDFKERKFPERVCFEPIGIINSSFKSLKGIPIQSKMSTTPGEIEIFEKYKPGLKDLSGFSHIFCLYFFDMVKLPVPLQSKPFLDDEIRGVFSIRTPFRPNPIGLSILKIKDINENTISVRNLDILDGTPVLDIKPYISKIDNFETKRDGWIEGKIRNKVS